MYERWNCMKRFAFLSDSWLRVWPKWKRLHTYHRQDQMFTEINTGTAAHGASRNKIPDRKGYAFCLGANLINIDLIWDVSFLWVLRLQVQVKTRGPWTDCCCWRTEEGGVNSTGLFTPEETRNTFLSAGRSTSNKTPLFSWSHIGPMFVMTSWISDSELFMWLCLLLLTWSPGGLEPLHCGPLTPSRPALI